MPHVRMSHVTHTHARPTFMWPRYQSRVVTSHFTHTNESRHTHIRYETYLSEDFDNTFLVTFVSESRRMLHIRMGYVTHTYDTRRTFPKTLIPEWCHMWCIRKNHVMYMWYHWWVMSGTLQHTLQQRDTATPTATTRHCNTHCNNETLQHTLPKWCLM